MSALTIGTAAACCLAGAAVHVWDTGERREGLFSLAAFGLRLIGMILTWA